MDNKMEMAQLLARFKLQVKRALGETVDLERLTRDPAYARQRLNEIEEAAADEDLSIGLGGQRVDLAVHALATAPSGQVWFGLAKRGGAQEEKNETLHGRESKPGGRGLQACAAAIARQAGGG